MTEQQKVEQLAEVGYAAYCDACDNKSPRGGATPTWDQLPEKLRTYWTKASSAIAHEFVAMKQSGLLEAGEDDD
jgi:hypothetical protein